VKKETSSLCWVICYFIVVWYMCKTHKYKWGLNRIHPGDKLHWIWKRQKQNKKNENKTKIKKDPYIDNRHLENKCVTTNFSGRVLFTLIVGLFNIFSNLFLAHLAEGLSSVVRRPSVVHPVSTFSFKRLRLKNHQANFNPT